MKLEAKKLTKEYMQGDRKIKALNNVDFTITKGSFVSITGRSGSGKSTLLNIIAGLTLPSSGSIYLDGADIFTFSDEEISLYRNAKIGCIPQHHSVLANLSVLDNVRLPFHLSHREGDSAKEAHRLLKSVGLEKLTAGMPKRLSGGQLKRVAIARALINSPGLLIADEPTGDLDVQTTKEIIEIFRRIANEGTAVLMVTHDIDTTEFADSRYSMASGRLSKLN